MRTLASGAVTQFASANAGPVVLFVHMALSAPVRLNSSPVTINWSGNDWIGAGSLGAVEAVRDQVGELQGLRFSISGVPAALLSSALGEDIRNKDCTVYTCVLDNATHAVLDVQSIWVGKLDQMPVRLAADGTFSIAVTAEHPGVTFARPKPLRYTDDDQQRLYPGDTSLRFVVSQSQTPDVWPAASYFRQ